MASMFWVHFYNIVEILRHKDEITGEYTVRMQDLTTLTQNIWEAGLFNFAGQKHQYTNTRLNMDYSAAIAHIMTTGRYLVNTGVMDSAVLYMVNTNGNVRRFTSQTIREDMGHVEHVFNTDAKRREMLRDNPTDLRYEQHEGLEPQEVFEAMLSRKDWVHMSFRINKGLEFYILALKPVQKGHTHAKETTQT